MCKGKKIENYVKKKEKEIYSAQFCIDRPILYMYLIVLRWCKAFLISEGYCSLGE